MHVFHRTDSKDPDLHVLDGCMPATLWFNLKKMAKHAKISSKMVNPRDISGNPEKQENSMHGYRRRDPQETHSPPAAPGRQASEACTSHTTQTLWAPQTACTKSCKPRLSW